MVIIVEFKLDLIIDNYIILYFIYEILIIVYNGVSVLNHWSRHNPDTSWSKEKALYSTTVILFCCLEVWYTNSTTIYHSVNLSWIHNMSTAVQLLYITKKGTNTNMVLLHEKKNNSLIKIKGKTRHRIIEI